MKQHPGVERTQGRIFAGLAILLAALMTGCHLAPLPPVNLKEPGWTVQQGQAVWKSGSKRPEIAGDLILATKGGGNSFIQFSKTPFPLVIAHQVTNRWQVEFPTENKRYSGIGKPPRRLIWLWLSPALAGNLSRQTWSWRQDENSWRLENRSAGEWIEGYFTKP